MCIYIPFSIRCSPFSRMRDREKRTEVCKLVKYLRWFDFGFGIIWFALNLPFTHWNMNIRSKNRFGYGQRLCWINFHIFAQWTPVESKRKKIKHTRFIYCKQFPMISISILFSIGLCNSNRMRTDKNRIVSIFFSCIISTNNLFWLWDEAMARKGQMDGTVLNQNILRKDLFRCYVITILFIKYGKQLNVDIISYWLTQFDEFIFMTLVCSNFVKKNFNYSEIKLSQTIAKIYQTFSSNCRKRSISFQKLLLLNHNEILCKRICVRFKRKLYAVGISLFWCHLPHRKEFKLFIDWQ